MPKTLHSFLHFLLMACAASVVYAIEATTDVVNSTDLSGGGNGAPVAVQSTCDADGGCPRSSMVWASGSFTDLRMLTPAAFLTDARLTLQLSLCCRYLFHGRMLRDEAMYDDFLDALLYATPFRVLSLEDKRRLLPRQRAKILDSHSTPDATGEQAYYAHDRPPAAEDLERGNDGDGDILLLESGLVGSSIVTDIPFFSSHTGGVPSTYASDTQRKRQQYDVQLQLSNKVLKCKCPHTLIIMPLLSFVPDSLPDPLSISGAGSRCAEKREGHQLSAGHSVAGDILRYSFLHRVMTSTALPPFSTVSWAVTEAHQQDADSRALLSASADAGALVTDAWEGIGEVVAKGSWSIAYWKRGSSTEPDDPESVPFAPFTFTAVANVRYNIFLTVRKGSATTSLRSSFVIRMKLLDQWKTRTYALEPFFGYDRWTSIRTALETQDVDTVSLETALKSPHHKTSWEVRTSSAGSGTERRVEALPSGVFDEKNVSVHVPIGSRGLKFLVLTLSDKDGVCPHVDVEVQPVFVVQLMIVAPSLSPYTACSNDVVLEARDERHISDTGFADAFRAVQPPVTRNSDELRVTGLTVLTQQWDCIHYHRASDRNAWLASEATSCELSSQNERKGILTMTTSSLAAFSWSASFALAIEGTHDGGKESEALRRRIVDASVAMVKSVGSYSQTLVVDMTTPRRFVYRRSAALPESESVHIHTSDTVVTVAPPRAGLQGYWRTSPSSSLRVTSPVRHSPATVDLVRAPNTPQVLQLGSLVFVVHDAGELVTLPTAEGEEVVAFHAKCPDQPVEYLVHMTTAPPVEPHPDLETVWLEMDTVTLHKPRAAAKDETVTWTALPCSDAPHPQRVAVLADGNAVVTDVFPHTHCEVTWTVTNAAGSAIKRFSIRRCEAPTSIRFDGMQTVSSGVGLDRSTIDRLRQRYGELIPLAGDAAEVPFTYAALSHRTRFTSKFGASNVASYVDGRKRNLSHMIDFILDETHDDEESVVRVRSLSPSEIGMHPAWSFPVAHKDPDAPSIVSLRMDALVLQTPVFVEVAFRLETISDGMPEPSSSELAAFNELNLCRPVEGRVSVLFLRAADFLPIHNAIIEYNADTGRWQYTVEMCADSLTIAHRVELHTIFGFRWSWRCGDTADSLRIEALGDTVHRFSITGNADWSNSTCALRIFNVLTNTSDSVDFVLQRVLPDPFAVAVSVASSNVVAPVGANALPGQQPIQLRFVGPEVILHISAPASPAGVKQELDSETIPTGWEAVAVTPAFQAPSNGDYVGAKLLLEGLRFHVWAEGMVDRTTAELAQLSPAAVLAANSGGLLTRVANFAVPGVYTVTYTQRDPAHPSACPLVTTTRLLRVYRAQVMVPNVTVCDSTAVLQAVPLPAELAVGFYGQWEVVSLQQSGDDDSLLTKGSDFQGIRFEHGQRPRTVVSGLPFGVLRVRWAIYKNVFDSNTSRVKGRLLVDAAHVTLHVLTENLASSRVVTLSDTVRIAVTSSTYEWRLDPQSLQHYQSLLGTRAPRFAFSEHNNDTFASVLTVDRLRTGGVTRLLYSVRASLRQQLVPSLREKMCPPETPLTRLFEVERVTAFLSIRNIANATHECDAYRGSLNVTLCLEAGDTASAAFFEERVAFIDATHIEAVVKREAKRRELATHCRMPWWVTSAANWTSSYTIEDGRCLVVAFRSNRHLSPSEAAQSLFHSAAPQQSGSESLVRSRASLSSLPCPSGADVITSQVVRGVAPVEGAETPAASKEFSASGVEPFLAVLEPRTLQPVPTQRHILRPLIGWTAGDDVVLRESDLSSATTTAPWITFRLDRRSGASAASFEFNLQGEDGVPAKTAETISSHFSDHNVLHRCLHNSLRARDVVAPWLSADLKLPGSEEAFQHNLQLWQAYQASVGGHAAVQCEVMFNSLEHFLPTPQDTVESLAQRRQSHIPLSEWKLVTLAELESQLAMLNMSHYWTRDGIEISGLSPDLQQALHRKRLTKKQLEEVSRHRGATRQPFFTTQAKADDTVTPPVEQELQSMQQHKEWALVPQDEYRHRVTAAVTEYHRWTGEGVPAIRIRLPPSPDFALVENLNLRTTLHKNLVCGSSVESFDHEDSLVIFQRVAILDEAPTHSISPGVVKQCDLEAGLPSIEIHLRNTNFVSSAAEWMQRSAVQEKVTIVELENPNITKFTDYRYPYTTATVGITPCIASMVRGARLQLDEASKKTLRLQLSPCASFQMLSDEEYNEHHDSGVLLARLAHPRLFRVTIADAMLQDSHRRPSAMEFVVHVMPTAVRTYIRRSYTPAEGGDFLLLPQQHAADRADQPTSPHVAPERYSTLICEASLKLRGLELGLQLVGDTWHTNVGAPPPHAGLASRTPQDTAMLNGFSQIEHHRLDANSFTFSALGGGLYRSHFIHYLFTSSLSNPRATPKIVRYNDSFVGVRVPPSAASSTSAADESPSDALPDALSTPASGVLPTALPFSTTEEILFAVPGLATQCRGCLLSDRTFFVAGDASGLWRPGAGAVATTPSASTRQLVVPVLTPMSSAEEAFTTWSYDWLCASQPHDFLDSVVRRYVDVRLKSRVVPFLQLRIVALQTRDLTGNLLSADQRAVEVLSSQPVLLNDRGSFTVAGGQASTTFRVPEDALETAVDRFAQDMRRIRHGSHLRHLSKGTDSNLSRAAQDTDNAFVKPLFDYARHDGIEGGRMYVNATLLLRLCVKDTDCTILNYQPAMLVVESRADFEKYHQGRDGGVGSVLGSLTRRPLLLLHHAGTTALVYVISNGALGPMPSHRRTILCAGAFAALCAVSVVMESLWIAAWLGLWAQTLRSASGLAVVAAFGLHGVLYALTLREQ